MKTCLNLPRYVVQNMTGENLNLDKLVWISIGEPDKGFEHVQNPVLDKIPKMKILFHDITSMDFDIDYSDLVVPDRKIAHRIVRFILEHSAKNFIINCAAGVSRSGAICKFMEDHLEYKWPELTKKFALPNILLYNLLVQAYNEKKSKVWPKE